MNNRFNNPFCPHCKDFLVESVIDRYSQYVGVKESWNILRDIMETIDSSLIFETDHCLIHLYYTEPMCANSILWLYIDFINISNTPLRFRKLIFISYLKVINFLKGLQQFLFSSSPHLSWWQGPFEIQSKTFFFN